jgi:predicted house-cleaning NTP pyrophosphatase (Maf/HAM1 superfamily)
MAPSAITGATADAVVVAKDAVVAQNAIVEKEKTPLEAISWLETLPGK